VRSVSQFHSSAVPDARGEWYFCDVNIYQSLLFTLAQLQSSGQTANSPRIKFS
jgi:hypothetical protein